jgi:hypothetical protein
MVPPSQAKADIDSIYSTGLYDDVNMLPQEAEDSTEENPKVGAGGIGKCKGRLSKP